MSCTVHAKINNVIQIKLSILATIQLQLNNVA